MLLNFSVENFRSFRDTQTINLLADSGKELPDNALSPDGVSGLAGQRVLKAVAIFGANASGKSNFVKAISFFFEFISGSATDRKAGSPIDITPFLLEIGAGARPTRFKATFVIDKVVYEYNFSVTQRRVESEELIAFPKKIGRRLFSRMVDENGQSHWRVSRTHFHRDKGAEKRTREDALFLSVAAQWNHEQLKPIYDWARGQNYLVFVDDEWRRDMRQITTERCAQDKKFLVWAAKMLREADTGISDIETRFVDLSKRFPANVLEQMSEEYRKKITRRPEVVVLHNIKQTNVVVSWGLEEESDGTRQYFSLLNAWYGILHHGRTAVVDELDSSLHSLLSRRLLDLVHSRETNPKGGQLIFTTHDTSLLDLTLLRRDQIYISQKDDAGASRLYPLLDFKPRSSEALQKGYLAGRYGGVPFLGRSDLGLAQTKKESE